jgi:hypothetical protein
MPNGEDEGQPPEDTGEEQPTEDQPTEEQPTEDQPTEDQPTEDQPTEDTGETPTAEGGEEQPLSGELEPASQPDEGVTPQEPDAGVPTPEELDAMEQAMAEAPKREMGPADEFEAALAEADTTSGPSEVDPTSVA